MKFKVTAIDTKGVKREGIGFCPSDENPIDGRKLAYLFTDTMWFAGSGEFQGDGWIVFEDTIKIFKH